jgi:hypothetical protein
MNVKVMTNADHGAVIDQPDAVNDLWNFLYGNRLNNNGVTCGLRKILLVQRPVFVQSYVMVGSILREQTKVRHQLLFNISLHRTNYYQAGELQ